MASCQKYAPKDRNCVCINDAIFRSDSLWGTSGVALKTNVPCNSRPIGDNSPVEHSALYSLGNGYFAKVDTIQQGIDLCVDLYSRRYSGLDPVTLVRRWANSDSIQYRSAVSSCFPQLK